MVTRPKNVCPLGNEISGSLGGGELFVKKRGGGDGSLQVEV
jgi:hypothetical protein